MGDVIPIKSGSKSASGGDVYVMRGPYGEIGVAVVMDDGSSIPVVSLSSKDAEDLVRGLWAAATNSGATFPIEAAGLLVDTDAQGRVRMQRRFAEDKTKLLCQLLPYMAVGLCREISKHISWSRGEEEHYASVRDGKDPEPPVAESKKDVLSISIPWKWTFWSLVWAIIWVSGLIIYLLSRKR